MKNFILISFILFSSNFYSQNVNNGIISEDIKTKLINELSKITGMKIDNSNTLVINFYLKPEVEPNGSCIDYYTSDNSYKRFFKKNKNILQFFITEKMYEYGKKNVFEDINDEIRKLVFEKAKSCGNYIIIYPNGEFFQKYGEYRQDEIPTKLK